jgi:glycosyltransferase involved in cell wall biosynthesis
LTVQRTDPATTVPGVSGDLRVAIDVGPLLARRTGIGQAVAALVDALEQQPSITLEPYVLSARGLLPPSTRRLPYPAALAHRLWSRVDFPQADRSLKRPSVIHGTNYVVPPAKATRLVTVYDCWFLLHPEHVHADVARSGRVLRRAVARGAVVHASSDATAQRVRELLGTDRVYTIPLGALPLLPPSPTTRPPESLSDGAPYILSLGTIERRKNVPRLVAAFGRAADQLGDHRLVLAGTPGDDSDAVTEAIGHLPASVAQRVLRLGWIDDETRTWLLHQAALLAYPSLDEGFGFPLLEAMSAGIPVVASTAGSIPEVAGNAALLVPAEDIDELAAALITGVSDVALRLRLVQRGGQRVAEHSWEKSAAALARLYHDLAMETQPR